MSRNQNKSIPRTELISISGAASRASYADASFEPGTIEIKGSVELVYYIDK